MKNIKLIAAGLFAGILIPTTIPLTASANIIDTTYGTGAGSFELGVHSGGAFDHIVPSSTTITGWTVGGPGDGVDWLTAPFYAIDDGLRAVDLQHLTAASISTVISTEVGHTYQLSFSAAATVGAQNSGTVSAGSLVSEMFDSGFSSGILSLTYQVFVFEFSAIGTSTTVTFAADATLDGFGPVIDTVSVVEVASIPEPDIMLIFAFGLAGLGYASSRRSVCRTIFLKLIPTGSPNYQPISNSRPCNQISDG